MTRQPAPALRPSRGLPRSLSRGLPRNLSHGLSRGLSLVELLVVTAVLAVLAGGVTLAIGRGAGPPDVPRFAALFETQRSLAIAGQQRRGLAFDADGARIALRSGAGWQMSGPPTVLGPVRFDRQWPAPQIEFLPTEQTSAFAVTLPDGARCATDGWAGLSCDG